MRLDHKITFWLSDDRYDPETHEYGKVTKVAEAMANVTEVGVDRSVQVFGKYDHNAKVIRFVEPVKNKWSYLTFDDGDQKYVMQTSRVPLKNTTLIVGESDG